MKLNTLVKAGALALTAFSLQATAGEVSLISEKNPTPPPATAEYEGGRGLLTIQRPTGMFINPTSGTLPQNAFTLQYCFFLPNNDTSPYMTHGAIISYGVTDWLELGAVSTARANDFADNQFAGGPMIRARLLKDDGAIPQLSVGAYASFGDLENYNTFLALYKRVEIAPQGFLKSIGFHTGIRETWIEKGPLVGSTGKYGGDKSDAPVGYFGVELQLPARLYLVGEVSTTDKDAGGDATPYGFGVQWRAGGINISASFINPGGVSDPSFFFGIGTQFHF